MYDIPSGSVEHNPKNNVELFDASTPLSIFNSIFQADSDAISGNFSENPNRLVLDGLPSNSNYLNHQTELTGRLDINWQRNNDTIPHTPISLGEVKLDENFTNYENLNQGKDPRKILNLIKSKNIYRPIIGHININFLEGKFEALKLLVESAIDILVVSETKIDASYPVAQFKINGFGAPFRLDRNKHRGGVMIYVRENIPCRQIPFHDKPSDIEGIFVELNLRKNKWLLMGGYNPAKEKALYFLVHVSRSLDKHMADYDNMLIICDLNSCMTETPMKNFWRTI